MSISRSITLWCDFGFDCTEAMDTSERDIRKARATAAADGWAYRGGLDLCSRHRDALAEAQPFPPAGGVS